MKSMCSSRSNLLTNYNFTSGTETDQVGIPRGTLVAAKISLRGPILEKGPKFSLQTVDFQFDRGRRSTHSV